LVVKLLGVGDGGWLLGRVKLLVTLKEELSQRAVRISAVERCNHLTIYT
jgi:hypothetical protein